jgi:hypothetical protein
MLIFLSIVLLLVLAGFALLFIGLFLLPIWSMCSDFFGYGVKPHVDRLINARLAS